MKKLEQAPIDAKIKMIRSGMIPFTSAICGARIVTTLAAVLLYPKTVAVKTVGIRFMKQRYIMLKAADTPNLDTPTNREISAVDSELFKLIRMSPIAPDIDIKNALNKLKRAPIL